MEEFQKSCFAEALEHKCLAGATLFDFARESSISECCCMHQLSEDYRKKQKAQIELKKKHMILNRKVSDLLAESASGLMKEQMHSSVNLCEWGRVHVQPQNLIVIVTCDL